MTKAELSALLERVEAETGGSSNLDAEIYATIGGAPNTTRAGQRIIPLILKGDPQDYPAYTASIEAALALVERVLPVHRLRMLSDPSGCSADVTFWPDGLLGKKRVQGRGDHIGISLAIIAALLRARAQAPE